MRPDLQIPSGVRFVTKKDSLLMRLIGFLLSPFNPRFLSSYWTTIGRTIYVPWRSADVLEDMGSPQWVRKNRRVIAHELVHVAQFERWGLLVMALLYLGPSPFVAILAPVLLVLGVPWFVLLAVFVLLAPLSVGLAWGRWRVEREAYLSDMESLGIKPDSVLIANYSDLLWGEYLFCWPPSWSRSWFVRRLRGKL